MSKTPELLPCPFCGGSNLKVWNNGVECKDCDCHWPDLGHVGDASRPEAIAAWNRRAALQSAADTPPPLGTTDLDGTHMCEGCGTVLHHGGHCDCSWNRSIVPVREDRL
jgi:hypothetical protein